MAKMASLHAEGYTDADLDNLDKNTDDPGYFDDIELVEILDDILID